MDHGSSLLSDPWDWAVDRIIRNAPARVSGAIRLRQNSFKGARISSAPAKELTSMETTEDQVIREMHARRQARYMIYCGIVAIVGVLSAAFLLFMLAHWIFDR